VPWSNPFCPQIEFLAGQGYIKGYPDGTFHPGESLSRQAAAAYLWRYEAFVEAGQVVDLHPAATPFPDVTSANPFNGDIAQIAKDGIANGYADGTFRPLAPVDRQAAAAFVARLLRLQPLT